MKSWQAGIIVIVLLTVGIVIYTKRDNTAETPQPEENNSTNLPVLVELGSHGCKACDAMTPVLAELKEEYAEVLAVEFHDVKQNAEIARQYGIRVIPTQVFKNSKGEEIFRHEGYFSKDEIVKVFREQGQLK